MFSKRRGARVGHVCSTGSRRMLKYVLSNVLPLQKPLAAILKMVQGRAALRPFYTSMVVTPSSSEVEYIQTIQLLLDLLLIVITQVNLMLYGSYFTNLLDSTVHRPWP